MECIAMINLENEVFTTDGGLKIILAYRWNAFPLHLKKYIVSQEIIHWAKGEKLKKWLEDVNISYRDVINYLVSLHDSGEQDIDCVYILKSGRLIFEDEKSEFYKYLNDHNINLNWADEKDAEKVKNSSEHLNTWLKPMFEM